MGTITYFFREAVRGLLQAKLMTFVSIVTIAVSLFFMSLVVLVVSNVGTLLTKSNDQADIAVYVADSTAADPMLLATLAEEIRKLPPVKHVIVVDKAAARLRFGELYGTDMLDAVDENPLPASLDIILNDPFSGSQIADTLTQTLEGLTGVESVRYAREWMDFLVRFRTWFFVAVSLLVIIIFVTLHVMISNTIKLTIYARKELIHTMYMVGATRSFISMPFVIEGMLQGLIGALFSIGAYAGLKAGLSQMPVFSWPSLLPVFVLLLGVLFGWVGSVFAVRKFMV